MNDAEIRRFLEEPNLTKLATINRDGTPLENMYSWDFAKRA